MNNKSFQPQTNIYSSIAGRLILAAILALCIFAMNCSKKLTGQYVCATGCLIGSIDFRDGKACITGGGIIAGSDAGCFNYKTSGNKLYLKDPRHGDVPFDITDDKTLKSTVPGLAGTYVKK